MNVKKERKRKRKKREKKKQCTLSSGFNFWNLAAMQCKQAQPQVNLKSRQRRCIAAASGTACSVVCKRPRELRGASVCCVRCVLPSCPSLDHAKPHFPSCYAHINYQLSATIKSIVTKATAPKNQPVSILYSTEHPLSRCSRIPVPNGAAQDPRCPTIGWAGSGPFSTPRARVEAERRRARAGGN